MEELAKLRAYLGRIAPGPVHDLSALDSLLDECWSQFRGSGGGGMKREKLDRMGEVRWTPPLLMFEIERHGGWAVGSTRGERQQWTLNVDAGTASFHDVGHSQLRPMQPRLNVHVMADEIAHLIMIGQRDQRLSWYPDETVRVLIGEILPQRSAVKQTLAGRRRRFAKALVDRLESAGWVQVPRAVHRFRRQAKEGQLTSDP
jgi:hypothetical protein